MYPAPVYWSLLQCSTPNFSPSLSSSPTIPTSPSISLATRGRASWSPCGASSAGAPACRTSLSLPPRPCRFASALFPAAATLPHPPCFSLLPCSIVTQVKDEASEESECSVESLAAVTCEIATVPCTPESEKGEGQRPTASSCYLGSDAL